MEGKIIKEPDINTLIEDRYKFQHVFEYASIGMAIVSLEGKWLEVNPALCRVTGYSEEELLQKTFQDITHPDDMETGLEYMKRMLSGEIWTYQVEKRYFHKEGTVIWVQINVSLMYKCDKEPMYFIIQIHDITPRKSAEQEKENLIEELKEALAKVKMLSGLIPICAWCKNIRDDQGYWQDLEKYICEHSEADFTHGICPRCSESLKTEVSVS